MKYTLSYNIFGQMAMLLFLLLVSSCEEEIYLELNSAETERIVVDGRITTEYKRHQIRITETISFFRNEPAPAPDSIDAYIVEEGTGAVFLLSRSADSASVFLTSPFAGNIGETYSLHIRYKDQSYKATAYLDTLVNIEALNYSYVLNSFFGYTFGVYNISIAAYEPPPAGDHYLFKLIINDSLYSNNVGRSFYTDDFMINGTYVDSIPIFQIAQEQITLDTNMIRVEAFSISAEEFEFVYEFISETYMSGSIFSGPPANIRTNIINISGGQNGVGFFSASDKRIIENFLYKQHDEATNRPLR